VGVAVLHRLDKGGAAMITEAIAYGLTLGFVFALIG
jgi:hypothetical protein